MEMHLSWGHELWFLSGLISFLVGHLFFTYGMRKRINDICSSGRIKNNNNWAAPLLTIYCFVMAFVIVPHVQDQALAIGVVIYAMIIGSMTYHSLCLTTLESAHTSVLESDFYLLQADQKRSFAGQFNLEMQRISHPVFFGL